MTPFGFGCSIERNQLRSMFCTTSRTYSSGVKRLSYTTTESSTASECTIWLMSRVARRSSRSIPRFSYWLSKLGSDGRT